MLPSSVEPPRESIPTVLIVDDDQDLAVAIQNVITNLGHRVVRAGNGEEALMLLEAERPALMLVDLMMPVMNGSEFLRAVRKSPTWCAIPRAIMTGVNDHMIGVREDAGVLYKPIDFQTLVRLVVSYCGQAPFRDLCRSFATSGPPSPPCKTQRT